MLNDTQNYTNLDMVQSAIDQMKQQLTGARGFGRTSLINRTDLINQLTALAECLPSALTEAEAILAQREKLLADAQQEAVNQKKMAMDDAARTRSEAENAARETRSEANRLLDEAKQKADAIQKQADSIQKEATARAQQESQRIIDAANSNARAIQLSARQEADRLLHRESIYQLAEKEATTLRSEAMEDIERQKKQCQNYIANQLQQMDNYMMQMVTDVRRLRSTIRNS